MSDEKQSIIEEMNIRSERNYSVAKDNRLIQNVTRRKHELSVTEQKVLCYILAKIDPTKSVEKNVESTITFEIRQFCKVCGIDYDNGNNYRNIKAALDKLAENSFWLDYGDGEFRFQWIVSPDIQRGRGLIEIDIPKKTMPYLCELSEKFTTYRLYNILALKSGYSIMLYELFKSYAWKGQVRISIKELRQYLCIGEEKYKDYKSFRRAVIERCIREIEAYTDIRVTFEPIRSGRYYVAMDFNIRVTEGQENWESYSRTMAVINGIEYIPGQIHLFD